jgi:hypothetical protein
MPQKRLDAFVEYAGVRNVFAARGGVNVVGLGRSGRPHARTRGLVHCALITPGYKSETPEGAQVLPWDRQSPDVLKSPASSWVRGSREDG